MLPEVAPWRKAWEGLLVCQLSSLDLKLDRSDEKSRCDAVDLAMITYIILGHVFEDSMRVWVDQSSTEKYTGFDIFGTEEK